MQFTNVLAVLMVDDFESAAAWYSTVVLGVDDVDARAAELAARGIDPEVATTPGGAFRLATTTDPAGNTVMLGQALGPARG